ncbi:MAG: lysophospholipid acyltransferase family protein [Bacteroidales bacterium]|nr:lysophospholipid acyltransferase family protein [Bacteroidales bacterium]
MAKKTEQELGFKRTVLDYDDISNMVPYFKGKQKLVERLLKWLNVDKVNWIHDHNCDTPGVPFTAGLLRDLNLTLDIDNGQVLEHLPEGAFITVSNHPFGALDGISLIKMVGEHRPDFKVMVNMVLNYIGAMRPNFIDVDALASSDPKKRAVSMRGIADAMRHVKQGHPLGFFPAGAVSKLTWGMHIEDRQWQPSIMRIIAKMKVPVIPIYFHGHNSFVFTLLGMIDWRLRTLRLPTEVFRRHDQSMRVSIGDPITPEEMAAYPTPEALGEFLKQRTYSMRKWKKEQ